MEIFQKIRLQFFFIESYQNFKRSMHFFQYMIYVEVLGLIALLSEACLGFPQLKQNCSRRSTSGMRFSKKLILCL